MRVRNVKRVAVIGGGPAGAAVAKCVLGQMNVAGVYIDDANAGTCSRRNVSRK